MTTPFWCLLIIVIIPYLLAGLGGYFRIKQTGRLDNNYPRVQLAALEGTGARIWAAQQNAWEAVVVFASSVFVAHLAGAAAETSATLAIVFVICRIIHAIFYIANLATLRSLVFIISLGCCLGLFYLAVTAVR